MSILGSIIAVIGVAAVIALIVVAFVIKARQ